MTQQEQVRNPGDLPDWPRQSLRGHKLEGYRYTSREFAEQEWEHIWTRVWLLLGREDKIVPRQTVLLMNPMYWI